MSLQTKEAPAVRQLLKQIQMYTQARDGIFSMLNNTLKMEKDLSVREELSAIYSTFVFQQLFGDLTALGVFHYREIVHELLKTAVGQLDAYEEMNKRDEKKSEIIKTGDVQ